MPANTDKLNKDKVGRPPLKGPVGELVVPSAKVPSVVDKEEAKALAELESFHALVLPFIEEGVKPGEIAEKLYPGPEHKAQRSALSKRIWRALAQDKLLQAKIADYARATLMAGLPATARGVIARAEEGKLDGVKLAWEATGFHSSKVQHEHSGDISVTLNIPRPTGRQAAEPALEGKVVD